ncbi:hypothetical protein [Rhodococcus opacus]|uniref:Bacteriophage protein n=1 Tax=Rhodococcus opacus (strain B4) TaxID=632772 RepID=C1AWA4_RHOOB|nr:hypothetical protein [Rhodococcus opacus]BAH53677.1 hypothetical protein ROP_54300 [Rhodococcus opacus B4]
MTTLDPYLVPLCGSDSGYSTAGDVLVNQTADGVDLNTIWGEVAQILQIFNNERSRLTALLSYSTTAIADAVPQSVSSDSFEQASEFGEPHAIREAPEALLMGYDFKDFDLASRMTWQFLRDASAEQVRSVITRALEADNKNTTTTILDRLFNPEERLSPENHRVFGLWTGTDGITPPPYLGKEFAPETSHYLASNAAVVDSGDIEDLIRQVTSKGYGRSAGSQLLILANPVEGEMIQTWRKGVESRTGGPVAKYDFVLSSSAPAYLSEDTIVGQIAPGEFGSLPVAGSYGPAWLIESEFVPVGYVAVVATGGPNSAINPVAFRQHTNPAYQGLRVIPGRDQRYPLQDSFFARGFGTGVRHRGAAAVLQVTTGSTYTAPTLRW